MKLFSFFLPQFHCIPENDEWWGKGFTEWVNVKKAKPLFQGHQQPKHPLGGNYYNLLEKETVLWQTGLMKKYGIDGLIYYHYYFKGKLLLEKPAENLLKWKDIDQPFFFCWANHTWNRSWNGTREILLKQEYGTQSDWEQHFQYLLPFFQDRRYEKIDNKPVFMIFQNFPQKKDMFSFFDQRCRDNGFDGIYIIETCGYLRTPRYQQFLDNLSEQTKKVFIREPDASRFQFKANCEKWYTSYAERIRSRLERYGVRFRVRKYRADALYEIMMRREFDNAKAIHGVFFEWDNTPRHSSRGYVIEPVSKDTFMKFMDKHKDDAYVFINAWNEWAEGMMLEPTEENGYKYLEWIKEWRKDESNSTVSSGCGESWL